MAFKPLQDVEDEAVVDAAPARSGSGFKPISMFEGGEASPVASAPSLPEPGIGTALMKGVRDALTAAASGPAMIFSPVTAVNWLRERAQRERTGSVMDAYTPPVAEPSPTFRSLPEAFPGADYGGTATRQLPVVPPVRAPSATVPSPGFQPSGSSTVTAELPGAIRRMFAGALPGMGRLAGDVGAELGVPGAETLAARSARALAGLNTEARAAESRLPVGVRSVTPDRITQALEALDDPRAQLNAFAQTGALAGPVLLSVLTGSPVPALTAMGLQVGPAEYSRYRDEGLGVLTSLAGAAGQTAAELGPERFALGTILKTPIGKLIRGNAEEVGQAARYVGRVAGVELGTEELSTALNVLVDRGLADPNATLEKLLAEMGETAKQMAYQGPAMAATARAARAVPGMARGIEERLAPQTALARAFAEMVEQGPVRTPVTIEGESRRVDAAPRAPVQPVVPSDVPQLNLVDRINALLGDNGETGAPAGGEAPLPRLLAEYGGKPERQPKQRFPEIDLSRTERPEIAEAAPATEGSALMQAIREALPALDLTPEDRVRMALVGLDQPPPAVEPVGLPRLTPEPKPDRSGLPEIDPALADRPREDYVPPELRAREVQPAPPVRPEGEAAAQSGEVGQYFSREAKLPGMAEDRAAANSKATPAAAGNASGEATPAQRAAQQYIADEGIVDQSGEPLAVNPDGTVTLYHRTTAENAARIAATGRFLSKENTNETFFSNKPDGQAEGYGDAVVAVRVPARQVRINDAFPHEIHVAVSNRVLSKRNLVRSNEPSAGKSQPALRQGDERDERTVTIKGTRALTDKERGYIDQAIEALHVPRSVFDGVSIVAHGDDRSKHPAIYFPRAGVISIHERRTSIGVFRDGQIALQDYLGHEITHAVDDAGGTLVSASSDRTRIVVDGGGEILAFGDLSQEIIQASRSPEIARHFAYPFLNLSDGQMRASDGSAELTAQVGSLYATRPDLVKQHLPKWFGIMEAVYGSSEAANQGDETQALTLDEARSRLRRALQNEDPVERDASGVERRDAYFSVGRQARPGAPRGPPSAGVGGGAQGNQGAGGNRGTGPGRTPAGPSPVNWGVDEPGLRDRLIREWQDNKVDLKRTQAAIEEAAGVGPLPDATNARLAETAYAGRVKARITKFEKIAVEPLLKAIRDSGLTVDQVGRFLWARHAPERNVQMARVNGLAPGTANNLSGLFDNPRAAAQAGQTGAANASEIIAGFTPVQRAALNGIAAQIDAMTRATRAVLVAEGLEDQQTVTNWERTYKHYVPLFRDTEEAKGGQGFVVRGPESKRAMGSEREAVAIVAAVIAQHEAAIIRAEKAQVGRALVKLAEQFPNPDFWRVDQPPTKRVVNPTTGLAQTVIDPLYKQREDVYLVKERVGGKVVERVLAFNPSSERAMALSRAMRNLDAVQLDGASKMIGRVTRLMANLATSWNPLFWATNFARDVQTAAINLQSTPLKGRAPQVLTNVPRAIAGIASAEFRNGTGKWAQLYREFEDAGGKTGWMTLFDDLVSRQQEIEAMVKAGQRGAMNPLKWAEVAGDVVDKTNGAIENGTRLAAFAEARTLGMTPKAAAALAKNLTVNFNRKGNQSTWMNAWYMFFNANVQGTARLIQALATSPKARAMVGALTAFGAAMELINRMVGDRDRDEGGNNPYELIPEHVRQKNMIFMLPGGKRATLPLPYGFNVFHNAGRLMTEGVLTGADSELVVESRKPLDIAWSFAQAVIDSFMPLGQSATPGQLIAPTVADPFVQHAENKTWYGAPMRPEPQAWEKGKPDHQLYFRSTSDTAKDLARWLSETTGGDSVRGGWADVSPTTLVHAFDTVTGGPGRFGIGLFDFSRHIVGRVTGEREPEDLPWKNVPFVGKFFGEVDDRDAAAKFYRLRERAGPVGEQIRVYRKIGEPEKAEQLEEREPALAAMARTLSDRDFRREMTELRKEFAAIDQLPREERARARRELRAEERTTMGRAIRAFNDAEQERKGAAR